MRDCDQTAPLLAFPWGRSLVYTCFAHRSWARSSMVRADGS